MERLPQELIVLICEHCDHASLKNVRLVNSTLKASADALVFNHFYMGLFGYGLSKLKQLAQSPYAKYVKKFTILPDVLPDWSRKEYEKAIDLRPSFREWYTSNKAVFELDIDSRNALKAYYNLPRHQLTTKQLHEGYEAFRRCGDEQDLWRKHRMGLRFKEFLSRLPNLTEASATCTTPLQGSTNIWPVWKALHRTILIAPDNWMYSLALQDTHYASLSGQAAVALLAGVAYRASFSGNSQVTKLSVFSAHLDSYNNLLSDWSWNQTITHNLYCTYRLSDGLGDAFTNVTDLNIHVPHATLTAGLNGLGLAKETIAFLLAAKNLRRLDLRYGDDELSPGDDSRHLTSLFDSGGAYWPHLKTLSLATNLPANILINFLFRHNTTLKSLELKDMLVDDTDYAIEHIPKVLQLEHVYVECLWDKADPSKPYPPVICALSRGTDFQAPYERGVKAYLLGQTAKMPFIERDGLHGGPTEWQDDDQQDEDDDEDDQ